MMLFVQNPEVLGRVAAFMLDSLVDDTGNWLRYPDTPIIQALAANAVRGVPGASKPRALVAGVRAPWRSQTVRRSAHGQASPTRCGRW